MHTLRVCKDIRARACTSVFRYFSPCKRTTMAFWVPAAHSTAGSFVCSFPYGWLQQSLLFHLIGRGSELINPQLAAERSVSFIIFFYYYYLRMKQFKGNRRKKEVIMQAVLEAQGSAIGVCTEINPGQPRAGSCCCVEHWARGGL